jgi:hypothetical protein
MDVSLDADHIIYKGWKFGFHKRLAKGVKRWVCTKYKCNAYIKTSGAENEVIFESLTHQHGGEKDVGSADSSTRDDVNFHLVPAKTSLNMDFGLEESTQALRTKNAGSKRKKSAGATCKKTKYSNKENAFDGVDYEQNADEHKGAIPPTKDLNEYSNNIQKKYQNNVLHQESKNCLVSSAKSNTLPSTSTVIPKKNNISFLKTNCLRQANKLKDDLQNLSLENVSNRDNSKSSLVYNTGNEDSESNSEDSESNLECDTDNEDGESSLEYDSDNEDEEDVNRLVEKLYFLHKLKRYYQSSSWIDADIAEIEFILRLRNIII